MVETMEEVMHPGAENLKDPDFPYAPAGWTRAAAEEVAQAEGLAMTEDHWLALRALQQYFARHQDSVGIQLRTLHDALDEAMHTKGGIKYLYHLFPAGPIAQGCRLAGLKPPTGVTDKGMGSVV